VSFDETLLIFLGEGGGWLRTSGGKTVARGSELASGAWAVEPDTGRSVLVLPGSDVALHWIDLPVHLAPAQARAAARLLAAELSAEPMEDVHVAVGPVPKTGEKRCMALVSKRRVSEALEQADALGVKVDHLISLPMLIAPPESGVRLYHHNGLDNVSGPERGFAAPPSLVQQILAGEPAETIDAATFETGLPAALAMMPVDLLQGDFATPTNSAFNRANLKWLAILAAAILAAGLVIQLAQIARHSLAANAVAQETLVLASTGLPAGAEIIEPEAQLRQRLAALGGGPGFSGVAGALFNAIRDTESAELQSLVFTDETGAQISVAVETAEGVAALREAMIAQGLVATAGPVRDGGSRQIAEFVVRAP
jgi:general secretion pathway protein L